VAVLDTFDASACCDTWSSLASLPRCADHMLPTGLFTPHPSGRTAWHGPGLNRAAGRLRGSSECLADYGNSQVTGLRPDWSGGGPPGAPPLLPCRMRFVSGRHSAQAALNTPDVTS
jgi:hypothetical protein